MKRTRNLNDAAFDENGLLRDGHVYRRGMMFMDSADDGLPHRPGFVRTRISDAAARAKQAAYDAYHDDLVSAYKNPFGIAADADPDIEGYGSKGPRPRRRGDPGPVEFKPQPWKGEFPGDDQDNDLDEDDDEPSRRRCKRFQKRDPFGRETGSTSENARIHDGKGDSGFAMHRPGFRVSDAPPSDELQRAYDAYEHDLTTAYRRGAGKEDVVPDAPRASGCDAMPVDDIETAYRLYTEEISQAWKTPR